MSVAMTISLEEILALGVGERLELVQRVWDSIAAESNSLPLTSRQPSTDPGISKPRSW